jgi:hypothetical protein
MCFHISFLLLLAFANVAVAQTPFDNEARFQQAMKFYAEKDYLQSARILRDLIRADREKSLYWFNFGNCLFMMKRYDGSIKFFNKVISLNTKLVTVAKIYKAKALVAVGKNSEAQLLLQEVLAERIPAGLEKMAQIDMAIIQGIFDREDQALARYRENDADAAEKILLSGNTGELSGDAQILLGMIYIKQNRKIEAEKLFFKLSRNRFLETEQQEMVKDFLRRTRKGESLTKNYGLALDAAVVSTSNVYLDGDSQTLIPSSVIKMNADFSYRFFKDEPLSVFTVYNLNAEEPLAAPELKILYHTLSTGADFQTGSLQLSGKLFFQQQNWNSQSVVQRTGITLGAEMQTTDTQYGAALDLVAKNPTQASYGYLKGEEFAIKPYYGFWTESLFMQFAVTAGIDNVADILYADGTLLPLNQNFSGISARTVWEINKSHLLSGGLAFTQRSFKTASLPSGKKRTDTEIQLQARYMYYFLPNLSLNVTIESITNNSTLGAGDVRDKNYKVNNIGVGLTWDVFE